MFESFYSIFRYRILFLNIHSHVITWHTRTTCHEHSPSITVNELGILFRAWTVGSTNPIASRVIVLLNNYYELDIFLTVSNLSTTHLEFFFWY